MSRQCLSKSLHQQNNLLHAAFQYAIKQEIFEFNPLMRVDRPKAKKYKASYYSVEEVKTLESLAEDDPLYIPIILAAYCGVRRSEALGVTWDNVDFEKNEIHIHRMSEEQKKQKTLENTGFFKGLWRRV